LYLLPSDEDEPKQNRRSSLLKGGLHPCLLPPSVAYLQSHCWLEPQCPWASMGGEHTSAQLVVRERGRELIQVACIDFCLLFSSSFSLGKQSENWLAILEAKLSFWIYCTPKMVEKKYTHTHTHTHTHKMGLKNITSKQIMLLDACEAPWQAHSFRDMTYPERGYFLMLRK
jgi:hypothetical protein